MEVLGASTSPKIHPYQLHSVSIMIGTAFLDGVEEEVTSKELKTADWDAIRVYKRGMYNDLAAAYMGWRCSAAHWHIPS